MDLKPEFIDAIAKLGLDPAAIEKDFSSLLTGGLASQQPALYRLCRALFEKPDDKPLDA